MAIPKQISFVTFDVYGLLIDSDTGAYDAFEKEADRDGFTIERDELVPLFHEIQKQIQAGSYELYAAVQRWQPFKETNPVLAKIAKKHKIGLISNIDDKLLGQTRRHMSFYYDPAAT